MLAQRRASCRGTAPRRRRIGWCPRRSANDLAVTEDGIEAARVVKRQPLLPLAGFISGQPALTLVTGACSQFLDGIRPSQDTGNASVQFEAIRREGLRDYGLRF